MKVVKSWSQVYEHEGHKVSADSNNEYIYLTIDNETRKDNCIAVTHKQLESLLFIVTEAIDTLKKNGNWLPKVKK